MTDGEDGDFFAVAVECGLQRKLKAEADLDHLHVKLSISIPVPQDAMIQAAGFHAAQNPMEPIEEEFYIQPPRPLSKFHHPQEIWFPSQKTPLWVIFKFRLEEFVAPDQMKADIDLTQLFFEAENK